MAEPRSVVIAGASRGLGFASTTRLYREGWRVVAAMRTRERGMASLREATGAAEDDDRLIGVQLDLMNSESISAAGKALDDREPFHRRAVGPDVLMLLLSNRFLPATGMHQLSRVARGIPRHGAMRGGAFPLTGAQRAMVFATRVLPQPVMQRVASLVMRRSAPRRPRHRKSRTMPEFPPLKEQ